MQTEAVICILPGEFASNFVCVVYGRGLMLVVSRMIERVVCFYLLSPTDDSIRIRRKKSNNRLIYVGAKSSEEESNFQTIGFAPFVLFGFLTQGPLVGCLFPLTIYFFLYWIQDINTQTH